MRRTTGPLPIEPTSRHARRLLGVALARTAAVALLIFFAAFLALPLAGPSTADVFVVLGFVLPGVWLAAELVLPRTTALSDWGVLLDGKAPAADAVFAATYRELQQHAVPAQVQPRRVRVGPPVPGLRNMLRLRLGRFAAVITVLPFGNDLYVNWSLTRREIPVVTVFRWVVSLVAVDTGYVDVIEVEPAKALHQAVHHTVLAGCEADASVLLAETFGAELPVEEADHRAL